MLNLTYEKERRGLPSPSFIYHRLLPSNSYASKFHCHVRGNVEQRGKLSPAIVLERGRAIRWMIYRGSSRPILWIEAGVEGVRGNFKRERRKTAFGVRHVRLTAFPF